MNIFLLRHGIAESRERHIPDAERELTAKGERELRRVLAVAKKAGTEPEVILTSPLRRAQQTAAIAAEVLGAGEIKETRALLPDADAEKLWKVLEKYPDASQVMVAGHEPHLSSFLQFLLGVTVPFDFKKGALVRVTAESPGGPPRGVLKWMLTPRLAR